MKHWLGGMAVLAGLVWYSPALAECLTRPVTDSRGGKHSIQIVVPPAELRDYQAKGFEVTACTIKDVATFRKNMCELAKRGNEAVQNRLEQVLGIRPTRICASVTLITPKLKSEGVSRTPSSIAGDVASGQ